MPGEVWALAASPHDPALVAASVRTPAGFQNGILRLPEEAAAGGADGGGADDSFVSSRVESSADVVVTYGAATRKQEAILYHPCDEDTAPVHEIAFMDDSTLRLCDFGDGGTLREAASLAVAGGEDAAAACWNPHKHDQVAVASGCGVAQWDLRSGAKAQEVPRAHEFGCTSLDYNPNRPFFFVTAGEDRFIKFWDFRKSSSPMMAVTNHTHWVTSVKYNPFHDQLLGTTGTDHRVTLWRITSISSQPLVELEGDEDGSESADVKVLTFEEHEDSVYSLSWSAYTAWIFSSLSHDGRVILHQVPEAEKYKILL
mmetsp:Transcript_20636/g.62784  ORF Transcript_20636/g.62784 Transcript_20636/m.62784 type:complete len:313 (+) Transcript_20636:340-1278(+)